MFYKSQPLLVFLIAILFATGLYSQDITRIKKDVIYLASDITQGRYPGTVGDSLAALYIVNSFKSNKR